MILFVNKKNGIIGYSHNENYCDGQIRYDEKNDTFEVLKLSITDNELGSYSRRVQQWLWSLKDTLTEEPYQIATG